MGGLGRCVGGAGGVVGCVVGVLAAAARLAVARAVHFGGFEVFWVQQGESAVHVVCVLLMVLSGWERKCSGCLDEE
jgi:hypothetical protein